MVKVYLSRRGVPFAEHNISTDRDSLERLIGMGFRSTPVTLIGDKKVVGYSPSRLDSALRSADASQA
jgi:glutaredoxin